MSYDLVVFDPVGAPRDENAFEEWLEDLDANSSGSETIIPKNISPNLLHFYNLLRVTFTPLNGPNSEDSDNVEVEYLCEYFFGERTIYLGFSWDAVNLARLKVLDAAISAGVGVWFYSDDFAPDFEVGELKRLRETL